MITSKSSRTVFAWLALAATLLFIFALPLAIHAAEAPSSSVVAPVASAPWYQSLLTPENAAWLFGLVSAVVAVFKNKALTTSQKSLRAVIVGVEQATQLPAVRAEAAKIKATIQAYAVSHGIQPELDTLVQAITSQLVPAPGPAVPAATSAAPAAPVV